MEPLTDSRSKSGIRHGQPKGRPFVANLSERGVLLN